jgi:hypothetical protein
MLARVQSRNAIDTVSNAADMQLLLDNVVWVAKNTHRKMGEKKEEGKLPTPRQRHSSRMPCMRATKMQHNWEHMVHTYRTKRSR